MGSYYLNPTIPLMQKVRFFFRHELQGTWRQVKFYWADPLYRIFGLVRHKLYEEQWEQRVEAERSSKHWHAEHKKVRQDLRDCISIVPSRLGRDIPKDIDLENSYPHSREGHIIAAAISELMGTEKRLREAVDRFQDACERHGIDVDEDGYEII